MVKLRWKMAEQNVWIDLFRRPLQNSRWRDAAETVRKWILSHTTGFSLQVHFLELRFHLPEAPPYQIYSQEIGWYCQFDRQNWQVNFSDRLFASMPAEQSFRRGSEICSSKNGDSHYCILSSISFRYSYYLTWAPPPQIYSQETGWYGQVEIPSKIFPSTPAKRWRDAAETVRKWILHYWLLSSSISWNSGFIYLKRHLTKSTVKRLDDIVTLTGKIDK